MAAFATTGFTVSQIAVWERPKRTTRDPLGVSRLIGFPENWALPNSHAAIFSCSSADPMLLIMLARYEIMAILSTEYGLLGSILSTDGILSKAKSYEIGMPNAGHISGIGIFRKSSRLIARLCFLARICLHKKLCGFSFLFFWAFSIKAALFFIRYSRIYMLCSAFVRWPFLCFRSILDCDWQERQILGSFPFLGVKPLSCWSIPHFKQVFIGISMN